MKKVLKVIGYTIIAWVVWTTLNFVGSIALLMNL